MKTWVDTKGRTVGNLYDGSGARPEDPAVRIGIASDSAYVFEILAPTRQRSRMYPDQLDRAWREPKTAAEWRYVAATSASVLGQTLQLAGMLPAMRRDPTTGNDVNSWPPARYEPPVKVRR